MVVEQLVIGAFLRVTGSVLPKKREENAHMCLVYNFLVQRVGGERQLPRSPIGKNYCLPYCKQSE